MSESILGGRYRIEARIGSGGMAEVYRGMDTVLNRTVAVKVLLPQFARDAGFVARFRREAQAAARLSHPNIVGVYDTGSDGDTQYIVMELIEGRTLAAFLGGGKKPTPTQSVELATRIAGALSAAHAQGIVHRDIKTANVMVTRSGELKVMDFGIARQQTDVTAPQTSAVLGTPTYLSPEQAQGLPVDARSDIYSLGVVLYEMLTGRPPFTGDSPVAIAYKQVNEAPVPPSQLNPDVSPRLDAVVMKALAKNPANRYQSAEEMTADLDRVRKGQEVEATPLLSTGAAAEATQVISRPQATQVMPPPAEEPPGSGRKVWLGVLIGFLVVAMLGGGGYLLAQVFGDGGGPTTIELPDVREDSVSEARSTLEDLGLFVKVQREVTNEFPPNTVLDQDPKPGTLVEEGSEVTLTVSSAPDLVEVPDLTGMTLSEASAELTQRDLVLGDKTEEVSDEFEPGEIIRQDIEPLEFVAPGTLVNVVVAAGPATVVIADYTCMTYPHAKAELAKLGVVAVPGGTAPALPLCPNLLFVALQEPAAGSTVEVGSSVTLYTGEEPSPSPTTTATPTP